MRTWISVVCLAWAFCAPCAAAQAKPAGDTVVYYTEGKKRVHVKGCRRLTGDLEKMTKMTLAEAEAKGLPLCSRCPGSTTPGKGNPVGLESWVKPAPDKIEKKEFHTDERAPLVSLGPDGRLVYKPYTDKGDRILDWSYCGYKRSEEPIPNVPVVVTLSPLPGETTLAGNMAYPSGPDSRGQIQAALDKVAALKPRADGFRGAVLLKKGTYYVNGSLRVRSGVVLRGEGDAAEGTVLIAGSPEGEGVAIHMGEPDAVVEHVGAANAVRIAEPYVPSGSAQLTLEDASRFKPGDFVCVKKTVNQKWIEDLGMGERLRHIRGGKEGQHKNPWTPEAYQFRHLRQLTQVSGNTITLDVMLPQSFEAKHGGGEVYKVDVGQIGSHCGVESLRLVSNYDKSAKGGKSAVAKYQNFKSGIDLVCTDSWVRNCTVMHVAFAAVKVSDGSRYCTIRDCKLLKPVGPVSGGLRYSFTLAGGHFSLVYNCYSEDGRHCFAGGSRVMGPNAFVKCTSVRGGQSEPHHRWGCGFLYDSVTTKDGTIAAINSGDSGTGHGWAAANTVIWNASAKSVVVFDPETVGENNFAFGFRGPLHKEYDTSGLWYANTRAGYWGTPKEGSYYGFALMGNGYLESPDRPVKPDSLFVQQLIDRLGESKAKAVLK